MNEEEAVNSDKVIKPAKSKRRWLVRIGIAFVLLFGVYVLFRLIYPLWIETRLGADAPRIAFSLDNTLLGRVGITDATYQRVITEAGGRLITLRPNMAGDPQVDPEAVKALLEEKKIDGVLLTGGGDVDPKLYGGEAGTTMLVHRLRDDFEIALIHAARERGLPILGICRGCQIINVTLGGTVRNLRQEEDVKGSHLVLTGHAVELTQGSMLAEVMGVTRLENVISLHGQAVDEPAPGIRIAATGPGNIVEAIEADAAGGEGWMVGIQWHPELKIDDEIQHKIFEAFVEQARQVQEQR